jgi:predicted PurR-regulated permease PerM
MEPGRSGNQRPIQSIIFGIILVMLFIAMLRIIAPFFSALLWAILLYIMLSPLHRRLIRNLDFATLKGKILRNVWAAVFTLGTLVLIIIPITLLILIFIQQAMDLGRQLRDLLSERPEYLHDLFTSLSVFITNVTAGQITMTADDIANQLKNVITNELQRMFLLSGNLVKVTGSFALGLLLISFSVFFFYMDGSYLSRLVLRAIPIKTEYISALTSKFMSITRNLFMGYIIVAALQSLVAFIVYTIFGVSSAMVFAVVTFILVFIPGIGATIVWIPLGVLRIISGDIGGGILFMVISMVFISGVDNILRPLFLKDRIQMHPLIIFFAILGGIFAFGFNGFILGPILAILFLTVLDLFLIEHEIVPQDNS